MARRELKLNPPADDLIFEFQQMHPRFTRDQAYFTLALIHGCFSLGFVDASKERIFTEWAMNSLEAQGFTEENACVIQDRWLNLVKEQTPLALRPSGIVDNQTVIQFIRGWENAGLGIISLKDAKDIVRILLGAFDSTEVCSDQVKRQFMLTAMMTFRESGITTPVALFVQHLWRETAEKHLMEISR